jgi:hypothetical protein
MTPIGRNLGSLAAAALLTTGPAWATGEPAAKAPRPADLSGVTVTAEKPDPLVNAASQFVRSHIPEGQSDQLARFRDDICIRVVGLPAEFSAFVAARIVEVAGQVRAPVDKSAHCRPNVNVIFTPNPQVQLDDIAKRRDILLGYHYTSQLKKLTSVNRPIQSWYVTRTRDATGNSWLELENPEPWDPFYSNRPVGRAGSRLGNGMSAEVVHTLILADANKVADAKIGAVADYIAVLALAKWQGLERCNAIPTILNLMADGCDGAAAPEAATKVDLALLSGLYAVDPRETGSQQRMSIASRMSRAKAVDENAPPR